MQNNKFSLPGEDQTNCNMFILTLVCCIIVSKSAKASIQQVRATVQILCHHTQVITNCKEKYSDPFNSFDHKLHTHHNNLSTWCGAHLNQVLDSRIICAATITVQNVSGHLIQRPLSWWRPTGATDHSSWRRRSLALSPCTVPAYVLKRRPATVLETQFALHDMEVWHLAAS